LPAAAVKFKKTRLPLQIDEHQRQIANLSINSSRPLRGEDMRSNDSNKFESNPEGGKLTSGEVGSVKAARPVRRGEQGNISKSKMRPAPAKPRVTRFIALFIALLGVMLAQGSFVRARQAGAPESSKQTLRIVGDEITIIRDSFGVPHIIANTQAGLYYGGGYAVAQDRLYQLERYRRDARGELAETEGSLAFTRDQQTRTVGYTEQELQAAFDAMKTEIRKAFEAYADGINAYTEEASQQNKLPGAFGQAGIDRPARWRVTDSVAIGIIMSQRFGSDGGNELLNARIYKALKEKFDAQADNIFNDLLWINDPKSPTTIPSDKSSATAQSNKPWGIKTLPFGRLNDHLLAQAHELERQRAVYDYARKYNLPTKWGSYAWLISPRRSASGSAILVGGPQMGFSTPSIVHEIQYSGDGINVIGMGFAGIPGVLIGHNDNLAWTLTSGATDMVDIFAEKLNPNNKRQYLHKGRYLNMDKRVEVIKTKGEEPREIEVCRSIHGPIIGWDEQAGIAYSRAASYAGHELSSIEALYAINRARNIHEIGAIAECFHTNYNLFVATADGDIGFWHCGKPPLRVRGYDGRLPAPGTGEADWSGRIAFANMPYIINPSQGYLANWNDKPAKWWDNGDRTAWGEVSGVTRIQKLIESHDKMTFEQARDIIQDIATNDANADFIKPYLLAAIEKTGAARDAGIKEALAYLRAWDNHAVDGAVAKTIFDVWIAMLSEDIFLDELKDLNSIGAQFGITKLLARLAQPSLILHALNGKRAGVPPSRDYFNGAGRDEVLVAALRRALNELISRRGSQMNLWSFVSGEVNLSPLPGIPDSNRGTYIQVIEVSKPIFRGLTILPPGQSEDPRSPHYGDQREIAGYWRFKPIIYKRELLEKTLAAKQAGLN
jgi:penicillin G amidase